MKKFSNFVCKNRIAILIVCSFLFVFSIIGTKMTKINYDILVYLPKDIETVKGQDIMTDEFGMGAYSVVMTDNMSSKEILELEEKFRNIDGVSKVISAYDVIGTNIPINMLPNNISSKLNKDSTDLLFVTFDESTSSIKTIDAIREMKKINKDDVSISGMSSMVLDTMDLSEREIFIYVVIAVILCLLVLELSLDSYLVPVLLLSNIGIAILYNLGSNIIFGEISYITKALVAVLQLGVTTDFSIFLYHSYENKKKDIKDKNEAMSEAICETFISVTGSSLTTIVGFLVLCTMNLTLGKDLGLVMAKGVFLGVVCVLTLFPSLLLTFDSLIEKTKHKAIKFSFKGINKFVIKHYKAIFIVFIILLIPLYKANSKVSVYYKIDESLPKNLHSIVANEKLKEKFNIVSAEIILVDKNMKASDQEKMVSEIESLDGIDFVLSFSKVEELGITRNMLSDDLLKVFESDKYQMMLLNSEYDVATDELNNQVDSINTIIKKYDKNAILAGEGPLMKDLVTISDEDFNSVNTSSIFFILIVMLFVLKSVSLPILLILAIEAAIFANMGISYFSGSVLPFVAPIVLGTIQLGATIDYAILLTTNFINLRKQGNNKFEAIEKSLDYCSNSIFVSGMCFFAATFGVGLYSDLEMVGSLCTLISRGAIISMIVVITVLPSILLVFDKLIIKTTMGMKGMNKMKKKTINKAKKVLAAFLITSCALLPNVSYALTKEETVYAKLNSDGSVKSTTVNEHLINDEKLDSIIDYSDLENITNTNSNNKFKSENTLLTWDAKGEDIFYQGTTKKQLPITESVTYKLNGEEKELKDILGKSGDIEINITYTNLDKHNKYINGRYENLYTPFVVATSTVIPVENNSDVTITNGKVINNGNSYVLVGLSSPGLYESTRINDLKDFNKITIKYNTKNFELSSIYSIITPKLISSKDINSLVNLNSLYSSVELLQSSIDKIEEGSKKALDGITSVEDGSIKINDNLKIVSQKLDEIKNGSISVDNGLEQIIQQLDKSSEVLNNKETLQNIENMKLLISKNEEAIKSLETSISSLKENYTKYALANKTYEEILNAPTEIDLYNIKFTYENTYSKNAEMLTLLKTNNEALKTSLNTFNEVNTKITTTITTLKTYLNQIKIGTSKLSSGTSQLSSGMTTLSGKMNELTTGTTNLKNGMTTLNDGIVTFNNDGIKKLSSMSNTLKTYSTRINSLVKLSEEYKTMNLSGDNEASSKFILVIDGEKKENKVTKKEESTKKETIADRTKKLFK